MCAKILMADGSEIRGKIGGKVYSRNASGAFVRKYVKPTNANTAKQQTVRNTFASLSSAYRTLSDADKATYESMRQFYKRTDSIGNLVTPTASQLFNRLNGVLVQNGIKNTTNLLATCPSPVTLVGITSALPTAGVVAKELFLDITFDNALKLVPADQQLQIYATPSISNGIKSVPKNVYKKIGMLATGEDTAIADIWTDYGAVFGAPAVGEKVYVKVSTFSILTGQTTSDFEAILDIS